MREVLAFLSIVFLAPVTPSCIAHLSTPSPEEFPKSSVAHRYRFSPGIDRDRALRIMANYPQAYQEYEESMAKCGAIDANHSKEESERCIKEPDCKVIIAFGPHGEGGPMVCVTTNQHGQEWSQERKRRSCLSSSRGAWQVYELTEDGKVYGDCEGGDR